MSCKFRNSLARQPFLLVLSLVALFAASNASAATWCVNHAGTAGCKSSISAAVSAATAGDIINVAQGTYAEQVIITKPLSLIGDPFNPPVIDATGQFNGIFVNGMATAPLPGIANVTIYGFEIHNARFEGILIANASNVTILANHVLNNNKALVPSAAECPGIPAFETSEAMDCGEGIHLMATDHAFVARNLVEDNSGGILITDETGVSNSNLIQGNVVQNNGYACGITMAGHPPATSIIPSATISFGIMHNVISNNQSHNNGLLLPGAGAGVGIFAPGPGSTNTANVISGNELYDNGLPGVTMHNHGSAPAPAPGVNLNDNVIIGNHIYGNAADTADATTPGPTGINIYSTAPVTGLVISQNTFSDETVDIVFKAPAGTIDAHFNNFTPHSTGIDNLGSGVISATENWWNCAAGPSAKCSIATGTGITTSPWLPVQVDISLQ
ncbi:right-handed parallel beta-helix repeat-containing protein [Acidicapsa ligni]|uniref:right-handed parallel beta-helix repeat-containing protein n=1 Tax=Acidicapsa ligni TaxID=542300 RepID=UPI0021DFE759|nr:right-handed parallel beta-helix repeat-containing protein [Acidicapsa ligni]